MVTKAGKGSTGTAVAPFDLGGWGVGELLGMYQNNGQYVPPSAGGTVSRAGERAAAQAAYDQAEADRQKVYGQAVTTVKDRNPEIQKNYADGTAAIQANARARAIADRQALAQRQQEALQGAAALGLNTAAPSATDQTAQVVEGNIGQYQTNADSWQGFNTGAAGRAVERNNSVGDAFSWQGAQQQTALAGLLQQVLSGLSDYSYGGSAGGYVGGTSDKTKLDIVKELLGYSNTDFDNELNAAKFIGSRTGGRSVAGTF